MFNIICSGFGGQGVLTAGLILARTGMEVGKNVTWIPSYGSEMRGGTANCNVKISDERISTPFVKYIDILIAMNTPSLVKFEDKIVKGGILISNSTIVSSDYKYRDDIKVITVEATAIAEKIENLRGANIVMLGALAFSGVLFDFKIMDENVDSFFALKKKNNPKNKEALKEGYENCKALN